MTGGPVWARAGAAASRRTAAARPQPTAASGPQPTLPGGVILFCCCVIRLSQFTLHGMNVTLRFFSWSTGDFPPGIHCLPTPSAAALALPLLAAPLRAETHCEPSGRHRQRRRRPGAASYPFTVDRRAAHRPGRDAGLDGELPARLGRHDGRRMADRRAGGVARRPRRHDLLDGPELRPPPFARRRRIQLQQRSVESRKSPG